MKRFVMALLLISAHVIFAADEGAGEVPSFGFAACFSQAMQGTEMLLRDAIARPQIVQAMRKIERVVSVIMDSDGVAHSVDDPEVAESLGNVGYDISSDVVIVDDEVDDSVINPDNNNARIAELQTRVVLLEEQLARRQCVDEEDMRRALNNEH
jgi:hypothetical protein